MAGVELAPMLGRARKRWRQIHTAVYSISALRSLTRKLLRAPSYTVVQVEADDLPEINQSKLDEIVKEKDVSKLHDQFGGVEGVVLALKSNAEHGIRGDNKDITSRQKTYGSNSYHKPPTKTIHTVKDVVMEAIKDPIILILLVCAVFSVGFGIKKHELKGWSDGGSIFVAAFLVIMVSASSNLWPKKQLIKLGKATESIHVEVIRNRQRTQIPIFAVVVGDIVCLKAEDQVPGDGLFLNGDSLKVDTSSIADGSDNLVVDPSHNPFLFSGTKVIAGNARMIVTSVGIKTKWGQIMSEISSDSDEKTPLQAKIRKLTLFIAKIGVLVAFMVLVVLLVRYFTGNMRRDDGRRDFTGRKTNIHDICNAVVGIVATPVAIAAAAIPEGLLFSVMVALAYSTKRMLANQALVRKLSACETVGFISVICTDIRGTLTMNHMKVTKFWLGQKYIEDGDSSSIAPRMIELLHQGIGLNETSHPSGSLFDLSEKAINKWGIEELRMNIEELKTSCDILHVEDFNSEEQRSGVSIRKKTHERIHVHHKGAPEAILTMCTRYYDVRGMVEVIDNVAREKLQQSIQDMRTKGLLCIAFAHKSMLQEDDAEGESLQEIKEEGFILLGLVGLENPCRPRIKEAVKGCQNAGVNIIMVTGDDMSAAKTVGAECGIIKQNQDLDAGEVVDGVEFSNCTADERMEKVDKIRVMAKASSATKLLLIKCLKSKGHVVAVTGVDTGDAVAFREADVGLSMGVQIPDIAKVSSDIIILDGNMVSVVEVLRWGRAMYFNTQTFTQFQLTVSISSLMIDFVTAISAREPPTINIVAAISSGKVPFATFQLLWVKLIMGTLAALALTIEQPTNEVMQEPPVNPTEPLITNIMWMNMLAQASYQIAMLLTIQFRGESIFSITSKVKDTMVFNTFVFFEIFTILSARKFGQNIVMGIQRKKFFWGIIGMVIVLQVVMVEVLNSFADTERLSWGQWGVSIGVAAVTWLISWIV